MLAAWAAELIQHGANIRHIIDAYRPQRVQNRSDGTMGQRYRVRLHIRTNGLHYVARRRVETALNQVRRHLQEENAGKPRRQRIGLRQQKSGTHDWRVSLFFPDENHETCDKLKTIAKSVSYVGQLSGWFFKSRQFGLGLRVADQQWVSDRTHGLAYRVQFTVSGNRQHLGQLDQSVSQENEVHSPRHQIRTKVTDKTLSIYFPTRHVARNILAFLEGGGRH